MAHASSKSYQIVLLVNSLKFGGAEGAVLRLGVALQDAGHRVKTIALGTSADYAVPNLLDIDTLPPCPAWLPHPMRVGWRARQLRNAINQLEQNFGKVDVVIGNMNLSNQVLEKSGIRKALYYIRNNLLLEAEYAKRPRRHKKKYHDILKNKDLLCLSPSLAQELEESHYISPRSMSVLRNVLDIESIQCKAIEPVADIPDGDYLLHIGRYTPQKRHDLLIDALTRLHGKYYTVMVTDRVEPLKKQALAMGLPEASFRVIGFQRNIYAWMNKATAVVNCSDYEGLCNVIIESTALSRRVIATDCPYGPREILGACNPDMLIPCGDAEALANKLESVLSNRPTPKPCAVLLEMTPDAVVKTLENCIAQHVVC